ncbi:MAG TPA: hypothetical protein ENI80_12870 [Acidiferrobacteraceae bacterium]|nr:hypothetical protein [Acidiferrobacteraceae bacterium]
MTSNTQKTETKQTGLPRFLKDRRVQLSVDTSGYCQARCALCVWPYLQPSRRMMTLDEFALVLERFAGFGFSEFAFNSINEPFADALIIQKMQMLIDSDLVVDNMFFSSNWLIPKSHRIAAFISTIDAAVKSPTIGGVSLNATVSGIDQASYDKFQAGSALENTVAKYKSMDFLIAVQKTAEFIDGLSKAVPFGAVVMVRIKAYGEDFEQQSYEKFWRTTLDVSGIDQKWVARHVKMIVNHGLTTFGRNKAREQIRGAKCQMNWLDDMLVVGPDGSLGLCCQEGARKVKIGSLLTHSLDEIARSDTFQKHLAITRGEKPPDAKHLCASCEWYTSASC